MTTSQLKNIRRAIITRLLAEKKKEYHCHIQFVVKVGVDLAKKYGANEQIIELSCLLHDIGRDHERETEDHADAGARIADELLQGMDVPQSERATITACIKNHNKTLPTYTLEEKIVISADCASKVLFHEAFMLLCKKQTYAEKLVWGKKYLEKGYHKILFPEYKEVITPRYNIIREVYDAVSAPVLSV
jgi:putative nucleotidyltransferase with HDIG domain